MTEILWNLETDDVYWENNRSDLKKSMPDNASLQAKPDIEMEFEPSKALAHLLINDIVFLNNNWWQETWPPEARKMLSVNVNCNDVFAWGCADAETMDYSELQAVYDSWYREPVYGTAYWVCEKRNQAPQGPVKDPMERLGYDFSELRPNFYDSMGKIRSDLQYEMYYTWTKRKKNVPVPKDANWREQWRKYEKENPGWSMDNNFDKKFKALREKFVKQHGYEQ